MPRLIERFHLHSIALVTVTSAIITTMAQVLPSHVLLWLAAWVLSSVPFGIGIGHCVLSED